MDSGRRNFLKGLVGCGGALAACNFTGCISSIDPAPIADLSAPVNGIVSIDPTRYPELSAVGGAVAFKPEGNADTILVVHVSGDRYVALSDICPHAGCPLGYDGREVVCPCHASRFATDGELLQPPAQQGLRSYPVRLDGTSGDLLVNLKAGDANFPPYENGKIVLTYAQFPDLKNAGGSVVGSPPGLGRPILVARAQDDSVHALDATCTHLGCVVGFEASANDVLCPCHGSSFDLSGTVLGGPARKPLAAYSVAETVDGLEVSIPA